MKKSFLFLFLTLTFMRIFGTNNPFIKNYSVLDGLPTNHIYAVHQDSQGFIWAATNAGVLRYDGNSFMHLSMRDGLDYNIVSQIKEDLSGRIWFFNMTGTVNYFYKNKIHNLENTPFLSDLKTEYYLNDFYQDKDSTLYFYNLFGEIYAFKNDELFDYKNLKFNNITQLGLFYLNKSTNGKLQAWAGDGIYSFQNFEDSLTHYPVKEKFEKVIKATGNKVIAIDKSEYIHLYQDQILLDNDIFQLETEYIKSGTVDHEGYLWIAAFDKGIYCIKNKKLVLHLNIKKCNSVSEDKQGNIWVASRGNGIYKINRAILRYDYLGKDNFEGQGIQTLAKSVDGFVWAATYDKIFYVRNKQVYPLKADLSGSGTNDIIQLNNKTLFTAGMGTLLALFTNTQYNPETEQIQFDFYAKTDYLVNGFALRKDQRNIYSIMNDRILKINPDSNFYCLIIPISDISNMAIGMIYHLYINSHDQFIINAYNNIIVNWLVSRKAEKIQSGTHVLKNNPLYQFKGVSILSHLNLDGNVEIFNFDGNQLYLQRDSNIFNITKDFELQIDHKIQNIAYKGSTLFFHTINTVYYIKNPLQITDGNPVTLNNLNIEFNNIHDILCQDSMLYIADDDGLSMIPIEDIRQEKNPVPRPYFKHVYLNDKQQDFNSGDIKFTGPNKLSIEFSNLNLSNLPVTYRYRLKGYNNSWQKNSGDNVTYHDLSPGEYTFELQSNLINNQTGGTAILTISVFPTIFQMKITWVLAALALISFISIIIISFKNRQIKQKENESLMISLEHKALQSMMNPHFIFNALGSIQSYLLQNKASEAGTYLSRFARLIRQNMNSLKSNYINVEDEIERLRNYLELEKFRADSGFNYSIDMDENLDPEEIDIPSMVVQPFVENAIWHGISPLPGKGQIDIRFKKITGKQLLITIEDNGVGLKKTNKSSGSSQHLHMGISLTNKRLKLISEKMKTNSEVITEERFPGKTNPGVRVTIKVPILNWTGR